MTNCIPTFVRAISTIEACQKIANTKANGFLDCLDDCSFRCFQRAFAIAKVSGLETVLITGPNGTGKSGYAKLMWNENVYSKGVTSIEKILNVNCGGMAENLIASELFGHRKGAFTGATKDREGKIPYAAKMGGCLFLDEIGDLPMSAQVMLLRFFQDREIQVLGDNEPTKLDNVQLKVICATNKDLKEEIRKGNFREDLYNRINKYSIDIPPLYKRPKDCERNARNFLNKFIRNKKDEATYSNSYDVVNWAGQLKISDKFYEDNVNSEYLWPGNFRELENRINDAIVARLLQRSSAPIEFADLFPETLDVAKRAAQDGGDCVDTESLNLPGLGKELEPFDLEKKLQEIAVLYIEQAKKQCKTKQEAAKLLGYGSYQTMDNRTALK